MTEMQTTAIVQITTTAAEQADASRIASSLVQEQLAACAQVDGPITSHYRWQGVMESATEWRVTAKTSQSIASRAIEAIRQRHPYDEPEILVTPVLDGSASYLRWVLEQVEPR